jgi:hypothetical protein
MKKGKKPMRLTVALNLPVSPELKDLVDQAAYDAGLATNELVAQILAEKFNRPDLAKIPRKPYGRPRVRVKQPV